MYQSHDPYHATAIDEDEYDFEVGESSFCNNSTIASTVNSNKKRMRKITEEYKKTDMGYQKIQVMENFKKVDIEYYLTKPSPGVHIRDAITGAQLMHHRVGSKNEDLYFKVSKGSGREAYHLYFDSPEQYERHMRSIVSEKDKQRWMEKCVATRIKNM